MASRTALCRKCKKTASVTDLGRCPTCGDVMATVAGPPIPFSTENLRYVPVALGVVLLGVGTVLVYVNGFSLTSVSILLCAMVCLAGVASKRLGL